MRPISRYVQTKFSRARPVPDQSNDRWLCTNPARARGTTSSQAVRNMQPRSSRSSRRASHRTGRSEASQAPLSPSKQNKGWLLHDSTVGHGRDRRCRHPARSTSPARLGGDIMREEPGPTYRGHHLAWVLDCFRQPTASWQLLIPLLATAALQSSGKWHHLSTAPRDQGGRLHAMMPLPFSTGVWLPLLIGQTAAIPGHLTSSFGHEPTGQTVSNASGSHSTSPAPRIPKRGCPGPSPLGKLGRMGSLTPYQIAGSADQGTRPWRIFGTRGMYKCSLVATRSGSVVNPIQQTVTPPSYRFHPPLQ